MIDPTDRLSAATELGQATRRLLAASVCTSVPVDDLMAATAAINDVSQRLEQQRRPLNELSPMDDTTRGIRVFNPVTGVANGMSMPLTFTVADGIVVAYTHLSPVYEGPPTYVHGGVSSLMMDQLLGGC
jgi:hypothetical protein